jgi:hypothetical protein
MTKVLIRFLPKLLFLATIIPMSDVDAQEQLQISIQGKYFTLTSTSIIAYGEKDKFNSKLLNPGNYHCDDDFFGDPLKGVLKSCYLLSASITLEKVADQYGKFILLQANTVTYGANGNYFQKKIYAGTHSCNDSIFGDPAWGVVKSCYVFKPKSELKLLIEQYKRFTINRATIISYGANEIFNKKLLNPGSYTCDDKEFGDPLWGVVKACYISDTAISESKQSQSDCEMQ